MSESPIALSVEVMKQQLAAAATEKDIRVLWDSIIYPAILAALSEGAKTTETVNLENYGRGIHSSLIETEDGDLNIASAKQYIEQELDKLANIRQAA